MKNNPKKYYIKKYYLVVSDKDIAERFNTTIRAVAVARRGMGLCKSKELAQSLRDKIRELS